MSQLEKALKELDEKEIEILNEFLKSQHPTEEEVKEKVKKLDEKLGAALEGLSLSEIAKQIVRIEEEKYRRLSERELIALLYLKKAIIMRDLRKLQLILDLLRQKASKEVTRDFILENELRIVSIIDDLNEVDILPPTLPDDSYISFSCNEKEKRDIYELLSPEYSQTENLFYTTKLRISEMRHKKYSWNFFEIHDATTDCERNTLVRDDRGKLKDIFRKLIEKILNEVGGNDFFMEVNENAYVFYSSKGEFQGREERDEIRVRVDNFDFKLPVYYKEGGKGEIMLKVYHKDWLAILYHFISSNYKKY